MADPHTPAAAGESMFARFCPLIEATSGLTLSQVCTLSGLEPSTVQNWIKRGFVPRPVNKKYRERHLARIMLIASLRDSMQIDRIGALLQYINGDTDSEDDDILPEEQLYDCLCGICARLDDSGACDIPGIAEQVCAAYAPDDPAAKAKLCHALTVMVYAVLAGRYKRESENRFSQIINR